MTTSNYLCLKFIGQAPAKGRGTVPRAAGMSLLAATLFVNLNSSAALAQALHTPKRVVDGTAQLVEHHDPTQMLRVSFSLTPPHMDEEKKLIEQLHDKKSPLFHKFLTAEQFNARFAPSAADEQAVVDWATANGLTITNRFPNRLVVSGEAPAGVIEKALNVTIGNYRFGGKTYFSNDRDPVLPGRLAAVVQNVEGLNSFERQVPVSKRGVHSVLPDYTPGSAVVVSEAVHGSATTSLAAAKQAKKTNVTPDITNNGFDPQDLYSSQGYDYAALNNQGHCCNPLGNANNSPPQSSIALATFGDINYNDIAGFHNTFTYLAYNVLKISIDGGYSCGTGFNDNCLEATLDTEWSLAMANSFGGYQGTAKVFVYESSGSASDMYNQMLTDGNAKVFSTSWGCSDGIGCSDAYMSSIDSIFSAMVAQGWSMVAASGDQGATGNCSDQLDVSFPSSDPNIVAVGGTELVFYTNDTFDYEVAWTGGTGAGACSNNDGGGTGGFSSYFGVPSYQSGLASTNGWTHRATPDISLNSGGIAQVVYYNGGVSNWEGTSIAAPEMAGFFAQENAYLLAIGNACGSGTSACAPLGNPNYSLYGSLLQSSAAHYPFYDILSGCNSNDITAEYGLTPYCAGPGYDLATGWGSANMLQLAWGINWSVAATASGPSVSFTGPATGTWYNTNQIVSWSVIDNVSNSAYAPTGIAGFTQGWDSIPADPRSEPYQGSGNSFYSGPQFPNSTSGCLSLTGAGCDGGVAQGCHTANVEAWNNMGVRSGDATYGPICYDTTPPVTTATLTPLGTLNGTAYVGAVQITLSASDNLSGVASVRYSLDGSGFSTYPGPVTVSTAGTHTLLYYSVDVAGNAEGVNTLTFLIEYPPAPVSVSPMSGTALSQIFTATYTDSDGAANINAAYVLFNTSVSAVNACYVQYYPSSNLLYLKNNAGTGVSAGVTPGSSATVSNSQCTLAGTGSSYSTSGNNATLKIALTFSSNSPEDIYLYAADKDGLNSGFVQEGAWGQVAPVVSSLSPTSGTALTQTFTGVYFDAGGSAAINEVYMLFNTSVSATGACWVEYNPFNKLLYLQGNPTGIAPGSSSTVSNAVCTLAGAGSSYTTTEFTATLNAAITFSNTAFSNIYLYASDKDGQNSGFVMKGTRGIAVPPKVVSVTPSSGSGTTQTFTAVYSDPNGAGDVNAAYILLNTTLSAVNGCYVEYTPSTNLLSLKNNAGTGFVGSITPGSSGTVSNSQCTLSGTGSSYTATGTTATLQVALTLTGSTSESVYLYASDRNGANTGWVKEGTWTP